jgi:hypothetical protein
VNGQERCRLRAEEDGWVLEIDGTDRLVLPARDGSGPYVAPAPNDADPRALPPDT